MLSIERSTVRAAHSQEGGVNLSGASNLSHHTVHLSSRGEMMINPISNVACECLIACDELWSTGD